MKDIILDPNYNNGIAGSYSVLHKLEQINSPKYNHAGYLISNVLKYIHKQSMQTWLRIPLNPAYLLLRIFQLKFKTTGSHQYVMITALLNTVLAVPFPIFQTPMMCK